MPNGNYDMIYSRGIKYPSVPGIYSIKNIVNNKVYIGSSTNLEKRIKKHIWGLYNGKHRNNILIKAFNKYGHTNFYFICLEMCDESSLAEKENFWINYFQSYKKENGYNIQPIAYSNERNNLSEETKMKISLSQKEKKKTIEHNIKNSLAHLGKKNPNFGKKISEKLSKIISASNKRRRKEYIFKSPTGECIKFTGLSDFCKENNLSSSSMSQLSYGKIKSHKGWTMYTS